MMLEKRYWLFVIEQYYPLGGLRDICETSDDLDALKVSAKTHDENCRIQIFDTEDRKFIWDNS